MTNAIETHHLTKKFGHTVAVHDVNLSIRTGEIFGFLGPNGAGKSTTIRMLCGILEPTSGGGRVGGCDLLREAEKLKEKIGYMSQHFGLYQDLTVEENLWFYGRLYIDDRKACRDNIAATLELLELEPYRRYLAANLSGGWRQRLALACSIVHRPEIVFLDEPTAGIDPVSRRVLWDFLYELSRQNTTLFVTTHYMEEAERCNRIGFIWQGSLVACDAPANIKDRYMEADVINLNCDDKNRAYALLKNEPQVADVNLYGDDIHITAHDAGSVIPRVESLLAEENIGVRELQQIRPSIEDVFVALSKRPGNGPQNSRSDS